MLWSHRAAFCKLRVLSLQLIQLHTYQWGTGYEGYTSDQGPQGCEPGRPALSPLRLTVCMSVLQGKVLPQRLWPGLFSLQRHGPGRLGDQGLHWPVHTFVLFRKRHLFWPDSALKAHDLTHLWAKKTRALFTRCKNARSRGLGSREQAGPGPHLSPTRNFCAAVPGCPGSLARGQSRENQGHFLEYFLDHFLPTTVARRYLWVGE